jgi:HAT1-interacting factor 1
MDTVNKEMLTELTSFKARALKAYATKKYDSSADLYAQACVLQSEIHGDQNPKNAHLLYLYGRSLYKVAQAKSDVLGAGQQEKGKDLGAIAEESEETVEKSEREKLAKAKKTGLFQFSGDDEEWDGNDQEDEDAEAEGEEEGHEDEMNSAWEILDLARVFFEKQLAGTTGDSPNEEATPLSGQNLTDVKTMLSDVYDLLGEVSLESGNFPQATKDLTSSLTLKKELYEVESTLISEAEFKLSLALEFSADDDNVSKDDANKLRHDAAEHIENAIASCRARIAKEEDKIARAVEQNGEEKGKGKATETETEIEDVKEMIAELEQRLHDLRNPQPVELNDDTSLKGLLGEILGGGADPKKAKELLEQAAKGANDLSGSVRRKEKPAESSGTAKGASNGKRKLEDEETVEEVAKDKKARVEDVKDSGA